MWSIGFFGGRWFQETSSSVEIAMRNAIHNETGARSNNCGVGQSSYLKAIAAKQAKGDLRQRSLYL